MDPPIRLPFTTLDVFTSTRYAGNPLSVVALAPEHHNLPQETKQRIAREFNLSETVFLHLPLPSDTTTTNTTAAATDPSSTVRRIDIFTTDRELPFAGHPTVGTACLLLLRELRAGTGTAAGGEVRTLRTKAGDIAISTAPAEGPGPAGRRVRARIPHDVHIHAATLGDVLPNAAPAHASPGSDTGDAAAIAAAERAAPVVSIVRGMTFVLVELASEAQLGQVGVGRERIDFDALLGGGQLLDRGPWEKGFVARYYFVRMGDGTVRTRMVELAFEDPATGSAASALASYLTMRMKLRGGEESIRYEVVQGVEMGRRSEISVDVVPEVNDDGSVGVRELYLAGESVVVMNGEIVV